MVIMWQKIKYMRILAIIGLFPLAEPTKSTIQILRAITFIIHNGKWPTSSCEFLKHMHF